MCLGNFGLMLMHPRERQILYLSTAWLVWTRCLRGGGEHNSVHGLRAGFYPKDACALERLSVLGTLADLGGNSASCICSKSVVQEAEKAASKAQEA